MELLQGHVSIVLGLAALVATLLALRFSRDERFRKDATASLKWFFAFLLLRLNALWLERVAPPEGLVYLRVLWLLCFAYGALSFLVAAGLAVRRRFTAAPTAKIHRDVVDFVLYVLATVVILRLQLKVDVTTLLGTSAVLSLVLGLALQDTLGNLFSGLSLQFERPFQVGDVIKVGEKIDGKVVQIAWRSTRIETRRREVITVPNAMLAKEAVTNVTRGGLPVGVELYVSAAYDAPPNKVKAEILEALGEIAGVVADPPPYCGVAGLDDSAIRYLVRAQVKDYAAALAAPDALLSRLWYRFGRANIEIPFPQTVVTMREEKPQRLGLGAELLQELEVFAPFSPEEQEEIVAGARPRRFGAGEAFVTAGREGETFYVVASGSVAVRAGTPLTDVATLRRGQSFGEMSLLTGEVRSATVVALEDAVLLELDREAFAKHFAQHPERAAELAAVLEKRKAGLEAAQAGTPQAAPADAHTILARLKHIFRLRD